MAIAFILLLVSAYLVGSIPTAYIAGRWRRGIDVRQYGSGNVGASNLLRSSGKFLGIVVIIADLGKGILMVWAAQLLGMEAAAQATVGIITIVGHNWPVFLRFRGGRGIFTSLGVITLLSPWLGLIILIIPYLFAPIRQVAFGVFLALVSLPFFSWFLSQPLGIDERLPVTLGFVVLLLMAFLKRLVTHRTELSKSVPLAELFFNRLLFDRDIRDART